MTLEKKNCYDITLKEPLADLTSTFVASTDYAKLYVKQYVQQTHLETNITHHIHNKNINEHSVSTHHHDFFDEIVTAKGTLHLITPVIRQL